MTTSDIPLAARLRVGPSAAEAGLSGVSTDSKARLLDAALPAEPKSLSIHFAVAAAVILINGMTLLGAWVSKRIDLGLRQNAAHSAAFFMESILEPLAQELATNGA